MKVDFDGGRDGKSNDSSRRKGQDLRSSVLLLDTLLRRSKKPHSIDMVTMKKKTSSIEAMAGDFENLLEG
jgi:hypothetical protein